MVASARLMVLMSPEERAALDAKARALGVSAGEVVRRAVQTFELGTEEEAAELRALIDAFNEIHPETLRIADESHRKVAEILAGSAGRHRQLAAKRRPPWREPVRRCDKGSAPSHFARRACPQYFVRSRAHEPGDRRPSGSREPPRRNAGRQHYPRARGKSGAQPRSAAAPA
jgi:hypothetical protein